MVLFSAHASLTVSAEEIENDFVLSFEQESETEDSFPDQDESPETEDSSPEQDESSETEDSFSEQDADQDELPEVNKDSEMYSELLLKLLESQKNEDDSSETEEDFSSSLTLSDCLTVYIMSVIAGFGLCTLINLSGWAVGTFKVILGFVDRTTSE